MKPSRFTEEQITYALKQAEAGEAVIDVCRRLGISQQTCSQWRRKYRPGGSRDLPPVVVPLPMLVMRTFGRSPNSVPGES